MDCPTCRNKYTRLGMHFAYHDDHRPQLSPYQQDLLAFLSLAGVTVRNGTHHPRLEVFSTREPFVKAVSDGLGWLANVPRIYQSAEQGAERSPVDSHVKDWSDIWAVSTLPHPELEVYGEPTDVDSLTSRLARWLVLSCGEWRASGPFGSLWLDVRGLAVEGDQVRDLLREAGVDDFCDDTRTWQGDVMHRGHWADDVVALPHYWALVLLDAGDLELSDVPHTGMLKLPDGPKELETDLVT